MTKNMKVLHGTAAWFDMVGSVLMDAATRAELPQDHNVSLVERYTDGSALGPGLVQGLRLDIINGKPSFRRGARRDECGDVTVEVTRAASYKLNTLPGDDPAFQRALAHLQANGELKIEGDPARLGVWFTVVHDQIVAQTS
jgi:hypothetical protein